MQQLTVVLGTYWQLTYSDVHKRTVTALRQLVCFCV